MLFFCHDMTDIFLLRIPQCNLSSFVNKQPSIHEVYPAPPHKICLHKGSRILWDFLVKPIPWSTESNWLAQVRPLLPLEGLPLPLPHPSVETSAWVLDLPTEEKLPPVISACATPPFLWGHCCAVPYIFVLLARYRWSIQKRAHGNDRGHLFACAIPSFLLGHWCPISLCSGGEV